MNFQDLESTDDPYPIYARWRQQQPIWWAEDVQGWVLSRYDGRERSDHHTFGHGIHFCIGAPLARTEARHALIGLLERFESVEHVRDAVNERTHSSMLRGYHHLWLKFGNGNGRPAT